MAIYMWREAFTPGVNTKVYIPFSSNYQDYEGNVVSKISGSNPTYGTTTSGEVYAILAGNTCLGTSVSGVDINTWTVSQWLYKTSTSVDVLWSYGLNSTESQSSGHGIGMFINNKRLVIFIYGVDVDTGVNITLNAWHNVVFTQSSGTTKVYVDGVLRTTISQTYTKVGDLLRFFANPFWNTSNCYNGRYDEFIFESKTWSDTEVQGYFNGTKLNYGIQ